MPFAVERTHLAKHDLDWLPPSFKALRWTVAGTVWTGIFGGMAAAAVFAKGGWYLYGKGLVAAVASGYWAGDRAAKALLRRRLGKLAHGDVDLGRLKHEADGELVHVAGRVRARETLPALVDEKPVVYRRVFVRLDQVRVVHEAAVDFALVDESGEQALVQAAGARLIAPEPKTQQQQVLEPVGKRIEALPLPEAARRELDRLGARVLVGKRAAPLHVAEVVLRDGDAVELVGWKTRTVDVSVVERLERDTPLRATLRSGRELPLVIAPR